MAAPIDDVPANGEQVHMCGATPTWLLLSLFLLLLPSSLLISSVERLHLTGAKACCRQLCQSLQLTNDGPGSRPDVSLKLFASQAFCRMRLFTRM